MLLGPVMKERFIGPPNPRPFEISSDNVVFTDEFSKLGRKALHLILIGQIN